MKPNKKQKQEDTYYRNLMIIEDLRNGMSMLAVSKKYNLKLKYVQNIRSRLMHPRDVELGMRGLKNSSYSEVDDIYPMSVEERKEDRYLDEMIVDTLSPDFDEIFEGFDDKEMEEALTMVPFLSETIDKGKRKKSKRKSKKKRSKRNYKK